MQSARPILAGPWPTLAALFVAGVFCVPTVARGTGLAERDSLVLGLLASCAIAPLAAGWLALRGARFGRALMAVGALLLIGAAATWFSLLGNVARTFGGVGDHFADDLVIPPGLAVREPVSSWSAEADHGVASSEPGMHLLETTQPGMYSLRARVNPGEDGCAFVRAFEVTRGVELSGRSLRDDTPRELDGSSDPHQLFPYETLLTIGEGNWGQYYAARFELWFDPSNGGPERMLISDVFRIEGWQR